MRFWSGLILFVGCLFSSSMASDPLTIHKSIQEVRLTVVATDAHGRPVSTLQPQELAVIEDGHRINHFDLRPASDLPLRVAVVLDLSGSMRKTWPLVRDNLGQSLRRMLLPQDQLLIIAFDDKIEIEKTLNDAREVTPLELPRAAGLTALYDTLFLACREDVLNDKGEARHSAVILFSDGEDNLSRHDLQDDIETAESAGIALYTIASHSHGVQRSGDSILQQLANSTGGRAFIIESAAELESALGTIQSELRSSYLLYYRTNDDAGARRFRKVSLAPTRLGGPSLRSREGYYTTH